MNEARHSSEALRPHLDVAFIMLCDHKENLKYYPNFSYRVRTLEHFEVIRVNTIVCFPRISECSHVE